MTSSARTANENIRQSVNHAVMTQRDWPVADFAAVLADPDAPGQDRRRLTTQETASILPMPAPVHWPSPSTRPSFLRGRHALRE